MSQVRLVARHVPRPERLDDVLDALRHLVAASRAEPGCLAFDAYRSMADDGSYVLVERYVDADAVKAHRASEHFATYMSGTIVPALAQRLVEEYDVDPDRPYADTGPTTG